LVYDWGLYGELDETELPFRKIYKGCGKSLIYIAARHGSGPDSKTFKLIEESFRNHPITFAIVEGIPSEMGANPSELIDYANRMDGTPGDAESYLTIRLATATGSKFQGGEPSDKEIMNKVAKESISPVDLLGFYIIRQIPQLIRREQIYGPNDPRLEDVIFNMVGSFSEQTGIPINDLGAVDGVANFSNWYKATNGVSFEKQYREEDSWPGITSPDFLRASNSISNKVANARDHHIVGIIDAALRKSDVVIVVYGGSHHTIQGPALKGAFDN